MPRKQQVVPNPDPVPDTDKAALEAEIERLRAEVARGRVAQPVTGEIRWFVCARCKGEGIHEEIPNPSQPWRKRRALCARCQGQRMVKLAEGSPEAVGLAPVVYCSKCGNWYAKGAGHPQDETNWPPFQKDSSHSHWFDRSFYPPPDVARPVFDGVPEGWKGKTDGFEKELVEAGGKVFGNQVPA